MRDFRHQRRDRGVLMCDAQLLRFKQDFRFNSPSLAAGVLVGGSANGRICWKDERERTLKSLQAARADAAI
ncbi:DUF4357 domain-containing protein [Salinisphaera orenii]|nr:DUF4357 domain-containing protein [Salinisphaera orenii]